MASLGIVAIMDEGGGGSSQQGGTMGMSWGGLDGGTAPMPPIFGNASASTSGDMDVKVSDRVTTALTIIRYRRSL